MLPFLSFCMYKHHCFFFINNIHALIGYSQIPNSLIGINKFRRNLVAFAFLIGYPLLKNTELALLLAQHTHTYQHTSTILNNYHLIFQKTLQIAIEHSPCFNFRVYEMEKLPRQGKCFIFFL